MRTRLILKGTTDALYTTRSLSIVDTRQPISFGEKYAQELGRTAVECGFVIVSGLAHGCEVYAHMGCIESNVDGIVLLAHDLDKIYPVASHDLAAHLLD